MFVRILLCYLKGSPPSESVDHQSRCRPRPSSASTSHWEISTFAACWPTEPRAYSSWDPRSSIFSNHGRIVIIYRFVKERSSLTILYAPQAPNPDIRPLGLGGAACYTGRHDPPFGSCASCGTCLAE